MSEGRDPFAAVMDRLLGPEAAAIVSPAVPVGSSLAALRPRQVLYRPRRRVAVSYDAVLESPRGERREERLVAMARRREPPDGVAVSRAGEMPVAVWRAPEDPELPGLAAALDPAFGRSLLRGAGVRAEGAVPTLRAYRPGGRAVVEVRPAQNDPQRLVVSLAAGSAKVVSARPVPGVFLKVLPPRRADEVADVHRRLEGLVPVARCTPLDAPGVLHLEALEGHTLGQSLRRGSPPAPMATALLELLERLGAAGLPATEDRPSDERLEEYIVLLRALVPEESERLARLRAALEGASEQPAVAVHGDFHEGNLLVGPAGVTGLLDVDDAGIGERVDDLGLLVGRVWSLGQGRAGERGLRYAEALLRRFDEAVDPVELRRRAGVALVGRATGPFRNQVSDWRAVTRRRLALAERWAAAPTAPPAGA